MSEAPTRKRKWMKVLLVASLAVNLLVVGVVVGTALRFSKGDPGRVPPGFGYGLYKALPKDDRKALRAQLGDARTLGSGRRQQDFDALSAALQAVPFEPADVQVLLDQQAKASADLRETLHRLWLDQIEAMTDVERAAYAERLKEIARRGPKGKKGKDKP
ncbi:MULTISPECIES: periplasmic heavy metal sensor [unclassified Ruegeria]|uniref:periplasmic heavy metal sensor n=1 Tax=unclassified Ruegeria TaxID=2625375 RepID=UPI0014888665|nr:MULTISPECIES: periplasmic heavy metal sensor [unclassified Ruegeria]